MNIYVISQGNDFCKVGIATNPKRRLSSLQGGNPVPLMLAWSRQCEKRRAHETENLCHSALSEFHVNGEWFSVSSDVAIEVAKKCIEQIAQTPEDAASGEKAALIRAIELCGGPSETARKLGIPWQTTVSNWKTRGRVPGNQAINLEKATGGKVSRHELRPDIYPIEAAIRRPRKPSTNKRH